LAGPTLGGRHGPWACFAAALLGVANFAWVLLGLPESLPKERRAARDGRRLMPLDLGAAKDAFRDKGVGFAVTVNFVVLVAFTSLDQTFRFFTLDEFALSAMQTGLVLAFIGFVAAGVQGGAIRPLAKRFGERALVRAGAVLQAAAFAGFAV